MLYNYYHTPFFRSVRTLARKLRVLSIVKRYFLRNKNYEESFHSAMQNAIQKGDVVWDIGANIGIYTNLFSQWVGANGRVVAIEPAPSTFVTLQNNTSSNNNITTINKALSDIAGWSYFSYRTENDVTAHLVTDKEGDSVQVEVITIDELITSYLLPKPTIVKIDVEGFEEEVIKGGVHTFNNPTCKGIFIEIHFTVLDKRKRGNAPNRIVQLLKSWRYDVKWVDASHLYAKR